MRPSPVLLPPGKHAASIRPAPRTGIIDAVAFRIAKGKGKAGDLQVRLIQLKGGRAGVSGREITRLKAAVESAEVEWLIAALDENTLHILPTDL